jgi:hypothetical protein
MFSAGISGSRVPAARDDQNIFRPDERANPVHGFLDDGPVAQNVEQVFRLFLAAARPEARSPPSGHDHGVHAVSPCIFFQKGECVRLLMPRLSAFT